MINIILLPLPELELRSNLTTASTRTSQKMNQPKCEVCEVFITNSDGNKEYFYYDVLEQQRIIPKGGVLLDSPFDENHNYKAKDRGNSYFGNQKAISYKTPDGKIFTKIIIIHPKNGKVNRPIRTIEQPSTFKKFTQVWRNLDWYYSGGEGRIARAAVFEENGKERYGLYDNNYNRVVPHDDWEIINQALYRTNKHGYLEVLQKDYSVYPDQSSNIKLGLIPLPKYGTFLIAHWIDNRIKYSVINIFDDFDGSQHNQIIANLSKPIYDSYGLVLPTSFEHNSEDKWLSLVMTNDKQYDLYGLADHIMYSGASSYEIKDIQEKGLTSLWFTDTELGTLLNKMEDKWIESFEKNKKYWEAVDKRNRINREKWQAEVREKEFKENVSKYKSCLTNSERCDYKFKDLLPEQVMEDIKAERQRAVKQQAELDAIPSATEMNYRTFDDHVMKNLGYTRKVWKNGKWEYLKD